MAILIFVALEAPNLVSSDLRNHTLPLYLLRPIRRIDYPVAKLIAFVLACLAMIEIPLLLLYLGIVAASSTARVRCGSQTQRSALACCIGAAWAVLLASDRLAARVVHGQARVCHLRDRHPLFLTWVLATVLANIGARGSARHAVSQPAGVAPGRPDQPVHAARRGAAVAGGTDARARFPPRAAPECHGADACWCSWPPASGGLARRYRKVGVA